MPVLFEYMRVSGRLLGAQALAAAGLMLVAAGCASTPHRTPIPVASPMAGRQLPLGTWRVAGQYAVGVSGMSAEQANQWLGREATYSRGSAGFAPDPCLAPGYINGTMTVSELAAGLHARPEDLRIAGPQVQVIDVRCGSAPWTAPGSRLIVLGPNRLATAWDGVMFELARE